MNKLDRRERLALLILLSAGLVGAALFAALVWIQWQRCSPEFDGRFYGNRDGSVRQCVCVRRDGAWTCGLVDR